MITAYYTSTLDFPPNEIRILEVEMSKRIRFTFLVAVLACLGLSAVDAQAPQLQEQHSYYDTRDAAVSRLRMVEEHHLGKGLDFMKIQSWHWAMEEWKFILRYFPNHPRALDMMATTAIKGNMLDLADAFFRKAMHDYPTTASTYVVFGIYLHKLKRYDDAIAAYSHALELDPASAEAHYNLGIVYVVTDEATLANRHAQAAYRLGHPLPGLREMLKRRGAWTVLPEEELIVLVSKAH